MLHRTVRNLAMTATAIVSATTLTALGATGASAAAAATQSGHAGMAEQTAVQPVSGTHVNAFDARPESAQGIDPLARAVASASDSGGGFSIRDDGQSQGGGGYFLTDEGHNNPVRTTGTGSDWAIFPDQGGDGWDWIQDVNAGLCLNAVNAVVYADSCQNNDPYEDWDPVPEPDGAFVFENGYSR